MTRITQKAVMEAIAEMLEDGQLSEDPLSYIGGDLGHGTRFVFKDSYVAHGPREAMAHLNAIADQEHGFSDGSDRTGGPIHHVM